MKFGLSKLGYYADFALVPLLAALMLWLFPPRSAWLFAALPLGVLGWSFMEYALHRWLFHWGYRKQHFIHHDRPAAYVGVSSIGTLPLFAALHFALLPLGSIGQGLWVGFLAGYLIYIGVHDRFHHSVIRKGDLLWPAFHRHQRHHHEPRSHDRNFGVTSKLWDVVFGTLREPNGAPRVKRFDRNVLSVQQRRTLARWLADRQP